MTNNYNGSNVRSVERAFEILKCFTKKDFELTLGQISDMTFLPKSTTHRLLQTMEAQNFIEQDPDTGKYHLSFVFLELADIAREAYSDICRIALPEMHWLSEACEQTTNLYILSNYSRVCIGQVQGPRYISRYSQVGSSFPLYCGASGRVILANMEENEVKAYLDSLVMERFTDRTVMSKEALLESVRDVQEKGYAVTYSERELYAASIAAPVYDCEDKFVAALTVSGPDTMFNEENTKQYVAKLLSAAQHVSDRLGYQKTAKKQK